MIQILGALYSTAAVWRRQWYARHPARRAHLSRPVVSVGNLTVGGSGKTPLVGYIARLLLESGERPAILTRGYGRRNANEDVTVVSDHTSVLADVDRSGDEPMMLARALPGVAVVVGASRYRSGRVAEARLGATVHVLDDGFQHMQLARDVDLLVLSEADLADTPMPAGRLREPIAVAAAADAVFVAASSATVVERVARAAGIETAFRVTRTLGTPHVVGSDAKVVNLPPASKAFAVAGIARPERFLEDLETAGWDIVGDMRFRDHHRFTDADVERIESAARAAGADIVLTTDKDAVRLESYERASRLPMAAVPLVVDVEPPGGFRDWLLGRVQATRAGTNVRPASLARPARPDAGDRVLQARAASGSTLARP